MRVIGGTKGGRRLSASFSKELRPTRDIVKEAVFNMLQNEIEGSSFLDLFAGVGSMGIEALSRGAGKVCFVEKEKTAVKILKKNLKTLNLEDNARVLSYDFQRAVKKFSAQSEKFNIAYFDPPYSSNFAEKSLKLLSSPELLFPDGIIMVEHFHKKNLNKTEGHLELKRICRFGETSVSIYRVKPLS